MSYSIRLRNIKRKWVVSESSGNCGTDSVLFTTFFECQKSLSSFTLFVETLGLDGTEWGTIHWQAYQTLIVDLKETKNRGVLKKFETPDMGDVLKENQTADDL